MPALRCPGNECLCNSPASMTSATAARLKIQERNRSLVSLVRHARGCARVDAIGRAGARDGNQNGHCYAQNRMFFHLLDRVKIHFLAYRHSLLCIQKYKSKLVTQLRKQSGVGGSLLYAGARKRSRVFDWPAKFLISRAYGDSFISTQRLKYLHNGFYTPLPPLRL